MKKYLILLLVVFFILISSVSATNELDNNITQDISNDFLQSNDMDSLSVESDINDNEIKVSNNEVLKSSDELIVSDFNDAAWIKDSGNNYNVISVSDDGKSVSFTGFYSPHASITQNVDWTNIESFTINYTSSGTPTFLMVSVGDSISNDQIMVMDTNPNSKTYDTSNIKGYGDLKIEGSLSTSSITITSISYVLKENPVFENLSSEFNIISYTNIPVSFTDSSSGATSYFWDFGDGTNSTEQNPFHTYNKTGIFNVVLTTFNGTDYLNSTINVNVYEQLIADFYFTGSDSILMFYDNSSGNPVNWHFDFGDGNTISLNSDQAEYNYNYYGYLLNYQGYSKKIGNFDITLTVTNQFGLTECITKSVSFYNTKGTITNVEYPKDENFDWTFNEDGTAERVINFDNCNYMSLDVSNPSGVISSTTPVIILTYVDGDKTDINASYIYPLRR